MQNPALLKASASIIERGEPVIMATVIETQGSTYRKAGARMLIGVDGELTGLIGGGCFEADLLEHAQTVFETGHAKTLTYDLRGAADDLWGLGLGCNGATRILLQLLSRDNDFGALKLLADAAFNRQPGVLVTVVDSSHPGFPAGSTLFLPNETDSPWPFTIERAPLIPQLITHRIGEHSVQAFYDPIQPPPHLLLLGAGDDALPVLACAKTLGWKVSIADHRPGYLNQQRLANADWLLHVKPDKLLDHLSLSRFDAAVIMSHNIHHDRDYLAALAASNLPYIGLLGPAARRERLLSSLNESGQRLRPCLYGPAGLDIGAETPEEIAISIVAGIQAALKGRDGRHLALKSAATKQHVADS